MRRKLSLMIIFCSTSDWTNCIQVTHRLSLHFPNIMKKFCIDFWLEIISLFFPLSQCKVFSTSQHTPLPVNKASLILSFLSYAAHSNATSISTVLVTLLPFALFCVWVDWVSILVTAWHNPRHCGYQLVLQEPSHLFSFSFSTSGK